MLDLKTLNSLDSMSKYKTYSKYNNILEKKFKGFSLKSLIKTCKNPRQFVKVKFLEEFARKHPYENEQYIENSPLDSKTKNFFNTLDGKRNKKNILDSWARKSSYTKLYEPTPDPFRYNPNYNSIFKNVPCCRIAPPRIELIKNKIKNKKNKKAHSKIKNKIKNKKNKINKTYDDLIIENDKSIKSINKKIKGKISKTLPVVKAKRRINIDKSNKNNHAFKFSDYIPRKEEKREINNRISYIEPYDYSNFDQSKVIDFGKMQNRDKKSILINYESLGVPSADYYNPKYELTGQRPAQILFTHQNIIDANKKSNKYLIHKLWTSYNVRLPYQLIDNDKLKKNINHKYISV